MNYFMELKHQLLYDSFPALMHDVIFSNYFHHRKFISSLREYKVKVLSYLVVIAVFYNIIIAFFFFFFFSF